MGMVLEGQEPEIPSKNPCASWNGAGTRCTVATRCVNRSVRGLRVGCRPLSAPRVIVRLYRQVSLTLIASAIENRLPRAGGGAGQLFHES